MSEKWLPVVGFEGLYEVSDLGRVRSIDRNVTSRWGTPKKLKGVVLSQSKSHNGYLRVGLNSDGKRSCHFVQRLVMRAFKGPVPEGMEVAHNDGTRINNTLLNLRYATHVDNMADVKIHGTAPEQRGEKGPGARLTTDDVQKIRYLVQIGQTHEQVAAQFGVSRPNVSMIAARRTWGHI